MQDIHTVPLYPVSRVGHIMIFNYIQLYFFSSSSFFFLTSANTPDTTELLCLSRSRFGPNPLESKSLLSVLSPWWVVGGGGGGWWVVGMVWGMVCWYAAARRVYDDLTSLHYTTLGVNGYYKLIL